MKFSREDCDKLNRPDEVCSFCGHDHEAHDEMSASCIDCNEQKKFCNLFYIYCVYLEERDWFWK
jgi:hypothetical protein